MRSRARRAGLVYNDYAFGVNEAGALTEARVLQILEKLPDGVTEVFFHPATAPFKGADKGAERFRWTDELAALTSSRVRDAIAKNQIESVTYGELSRWWHPEPIDDGGIEAGSIHRRGCERVLLGHRDFSTWTLCVPSARVRVGISAEHDGSQTHCRPRTQSLRKPQIVLRPRIRGVLRNNLLHSFRPRSRPRHCRKARGSVSLARMCRDRRNSHDGQSEDR